MDPRMQENSWLDFQATSRRVKGPLTLSQAEFILMKQNALVKKSLSKNWLFRSLRFLCRDQEIFEEIRKITGESRGLPYPQLGKDKIQSILQMSIFTAGWTTVLLWAIHTCAILDFQSSCKPVNYCFGA